MSRSVIGRRIAGQFGEDGGPARKEPSPSRIPESQKSVTRFQMTEREGRVNGMLDRYNRGSQATATLV